MKKVIRIGQAEDRNDNPLVDLRGRGAVRKHLVLELVDYKTYQGILPTRPPVSSGVDSYLQDPFQVDMNEREMEDPGRQ